MAIRQVGARPLDRQDEIGQNRARPSFTVICRGAPEESCVKAIPYRRQP